MHRTTFTITWETFMYRKIPIGLMNVRDNLQRVMEIFFIDDKYHFVAIYFDDMNYFSQSDEEHLKHLEIISQKCWRYGLSLNP